MYPEIVIAGCGNPVFADDGFGPAVVDELRKLPMPKQVKVVDAGICGPDFVFTLLDPEKTQHLIVIDCTDFGADPGSIIVIEFSKDGSSLHDAHKGGITGSLKAIDSRIRITLVGCQPKKIPGSEMDIGLSDVVCNAVIRTVRIVLDLVRVDFRTAGICLLERIG